MAENRHRVAIIDNSIRPDIYTPVDHWARYLNVAWEAFTARESRMPPVDGSFTHMILTGSEASIMDREPWVEREIEYVRSAAEKGLPILGSCYGHQLLAVALAGPQCVRRCQDPELGWLEINVLKPGLIGEAGSFHAYTLHFDEVIDLDNRFEVLAATPLCPVHAFRRKNRPFWGIQAHPEIDIEAGRLLLRNLLTLDLPTAELYRRALAQEPRDSRRIRSILEVFLSS